MRNRRHVALGTISFMVCFAALGVDCGLRTPLPRDLSPDGFADRIARCDSSAPRVSCPHPDGYSHRPFWWPCNLLYIDGGCGDSVWIAPEQSTRLFQLRTGVPLWNSQAGAAIRADDEVRHVLRPHIRREEADVRHGLPQPGADLRYAGYHWRNTAGEAREHFLVWQSENHH